MTGVRTLLLLFSPFSHMMVAVDSGSSLGDPGMPPPISRYFRIAFDHQILQPLSIVSESFVVGPCTARNRLQSFLCPLQSLHQIANADAENYCFSATVARCQLPIIRPNSTRTQQTFELISDSIFLSLGAAPHTQAQRLKLFCHY